jgi:hypothetical protein
MTRFCLLASAGVFLAVLGTSACEDLESQCACTLEFRTYTATVVDDTGSLVPDVIVTRTNLRTGATLEPTWLGMLQPGVYLLADDGLRDAFSSNGDTLRVTGAKGNDTFSADFVFAVPDPCRCHVQKLAGPDTVVIG